MRNFVSHILRLEPSSLLLAFDVNAALSSSSSAVVCNMSKGCREVLVRRWIVLSNAGRRRIVRRAC